MDFPPDAISMALSPDGTLLAATCAIPYCLVILDAETMQIRRHLRKQVGVNPICRLVAIIVVLVSSPLSSCHVK